MNTIKKEYTPNHYYAALKLIEQLYRDGKIPKYMFKNILSDCAGIVDLSDFTQFDDKEDDSI